MLRQGAKMLSTTCPECGAPLFQLKTGEIFCPREKREVKIMNEGETLEGVKQEASLEKTLQNKLTLLQQRLDALTFVHRGSMTLGTVRPDERHDRVILTKGNKKRDL